MFRPGNTIYAIVLIAIAVILASVLVINYYTNIIIPYIKEKEYIKAEIQRSTGRGRKHWERKLQKHRLSIIPLIGKKLAEKVK